MQKAPAPAIPLATGVSEKVLTTLDGLYVVQCACDVFPGMQYQSKSPVARVVYVVMMEMRMLDWKAQANASSRMLCHA